MRPKFKWYLLGIALFGVCAGYVNKPKHFHTAKGAEMDTYAFWYQTNGKWYYGLDLSTMGWEQGLDYDCVYPSNICTFIANPMNAHSDLTGNWFYEWDVPDGGVNWDGSFSNID